MKYKIKILPPSPDALFAQREDGLTHSAFSLELSLYTALRDGDEALEKAVSFGFPVILKAAAGGGGRGMRRCDNEEEVRLQFQLVKNEAKKAFGNEDIFIEKFLVEPKHIEVQILADKHGNVYHLGERDCSLQRRYQKVVELYPNTERSSRAQKYLDEFGTAEADTANPDDAADENTRDTTTGDTGDTDIPGIE